MDYEELEFDLEILPDRIKGYDSYIYLGEFNNFLDNTTNRIELLFRMDILEAVIISLPLKGFEDVIAKLESLLGTPKVLFMQNNVLYKYPDKDCTVDLLYKPGLIILLLAENHTLCDILLTFV